MPAISKNNQQKLRFAAIGAFNTVLDFSILFSLTWLGLPKILANIVSTSAAFLVSFFANRKFTFPDSKGKNLKRQLLLFTVVTLFGLWVIQGIILYFAQPALLSTGLSADISLVIAKIIATITSLTWNFLLYSRVVFK